jgi:DNA/RNA endonuclease G (NUC1)
MRLDFPAGAALLMSVSSGLICIFLALSVATAGPSEEPDNGVIPCTDQILRDNDPGLTGNSDRLICFDGYISNFDTELHTDGTDTPKPFAVPHWVIQHVLRTQHSPESRKRPRTWFTVPELTEERLAPTDASYHFSQYFLEQHADWYQRGHLAQKYLAERLGANAAWFTHNVVNALPQRARFNRGAWQALECYTGAWANRYGEVWIISGPIFTHTRPVSWLKSDINHRALAVAIPDEIFKIVVRRDSQSSWDALAFVYPQDDPSYRVRPFDPERWLTSVAQVELLSGQRMFPQGDLANKDQIASRLWRVDKDDFDTGCRPFAKERL